MFFVKEYLYDLIFLISYILNIDCVFYVYIKDIKYKDLVCVEKGVCLFLSILLNDLFKIIIFGYNG